jgi:hypothetical protein
MGATVQFGSYLFDPAGVPQWGRRTEFEAQGDGLPRIARTTYTIKQTFEEQSFADNEAQIHLLAVALATGEGLLVITDETGQVLVNQVVKVKSHDVPQAWRQYIAEVTVVFEGREEIASSASNATFTPTGGTAISLPNVQDWKQTSDITRFNDERANRREIRTSITANGFILANKALALADRRAALQAIATGMRACGSKDGTLLFAGENLLVRVERIEATIGDGSERLNWTLSCFFKTFPSGTSYAEADYTLSVRDDSSAGKRTTTLRGNIRAADEATGKTKAETLKSQYTAGRVLEHAELGDAKLDGIDGATWIDMTFDFEFSEPIPDYTYYELKVTTREDVKSNDKIISYSGKVAAPTAAGALAQAQALGANKYPLMTTSDETVSTKKTGTAAEVFVEVTFAYEYVAKTDWKYAELTREILKDPMGDSREVIAGFVVAASDSAAQVFASQFMLTGRLMREQRETFGKRVGQAAAAAGATTQMTRFDFSYTYYLTPVHISASYGKEERTDYSTSETTITYSGTVRGPSEAACRNLITIIVADETGALTEKVITPNYEKQYNSGEVGSAGADTQLISVSFSYKFGGTATDGPETSQAEFSTRKVYSINKAVITPIPGGQPFVQTNVGWTPGSIIITGSVTARTKASAEEWGKAKRPLLPAGGHHDDDEEETTAVYAPNDPTTIKNYRFNFTYAARYAYLPYV